MWIGVQEHNSVAISWSTDYLLGLDGKIGTKTWSISLRAACNLNKTVEFDLKENLCAGTVTFVIRLTAAATRSRERGRSSQGPQADCTQINNRLT